MMTMHCNDDDDEDDDGDNDAEALKPVHGLDVWSQVDQFGVTVLERTIHWMVHGWFEGGRKCDQLLNNIIQHVGNVGDDVLVSALEIFLSGDVEVDRTRRHLVGEEGTSDRRAGAAQRACQSLLHLLRRQVLFGKVLQY